MMQGGYNLESISNSALAVAKVLLGDPLPPLSPLSPSEAALKTVWEVGMVQSRYWKCMGPRIPVPRKGRLKFLEAGSRADVWNIETSLGQRSHWMVCSIESNPLSPKLTPLSQEMLNKHRAELLFATHNLIQVPLPLRETCLRGGQLALSYVTTTSTLPALSFV